MEAFLANNGIRHRRLQTDNAKQFVLRCRATQARKSKQATRQKCTNRQLQTTTRYGSENAKQHHTPTKRTSGKTTRTAAEKKRKPHWHQGRTCAHTKRSDGLPVPHYALPVPRARKLRWEPRATPRGIQSK